MATHGVPATLARADVRWDQRHGFIEILAMLRPEPALTLNLSDLDELLPDPLLEGLFTVYWRPAAVQYEDEAREEDGSVWYGYRVTFDIGARRVVYERLTLGDHVDGAA